MSEDVYTYTKRWRLERSRGFTRLIDSTPTRRHLDALLVAGWTIKAIAEAAGVPRGALDRVLAGQRSIKRTQAAAVLTFAGEQYPQHPTGGRCGALVPSVGTERRIQALLALGWTHAAMRRRCSANTNTILNRPGRRVTRLTHDRVVALYAELSTKRGPSEATRLRAAEAGFLTPIHWDNIDTDFDPALDDDLEAEAC